MGKLHGGVNGVTVPSSKSLVDDSSLRDYLKVVNFVDIENPNSAAMTNRFCFLII